MKKELKKYIGAVNSEEKAARFYDKYALIIQGFEVSTSLQDNRIGSALFRPKPISRIPSVKSKN